MNALTSERHTSTAVEGFTTRSLVGFFVATFALSWGTIVLYVVFQTQLESVFGEMGYTNPVFILLVWAPGLVGVFMVWRRHGVRGLASYFRRFTLWRMSRAWWLTLLVGMPAVFYVAAAIEGNLGDPFPFSPWYAVLPAVLPMFFIGPVEELGWRGVALPLMQRRLAPVWAGLVLGVIVAFWHTPAFLFSGTKQSAWAYWPFFFGVVAIGVILTAMFNAARGSLLVAFLFHAQMNNPIWPESDSWYSWLFVAVAVLVVVVDRKAMFSRDSGVTSVLCEADEDGPNGVRRGSRPRREHHASA